MNHLDELLREALAAARQRGHHLGTFVRGQRGYRAVCAACGCQVTVIPNPLPNECQIMGEAVAVECNLEVEEEEG